MTKKSVVRVHILGEEYSLRTEASAEHTRAVAEYLDRAVRAVVNSGTVVETQKAAILAALQITSELFDARAESDEVTASIRALSHDVRRFLPPARRSAIEPRDELSVPSVQRADA